MKNVTVYRDGKVLGDGELLTDVHSIEPPSPENQVGYITLAIKGCLLYEAVNYIPPPKPPKVDVGRYVERLRALREKIERMHVEGILMDAEYNELIKV